MSATTARKPAVLAAIGAICLGILAVWFYPSPADFWPDNSDWNGLSEAAAEWTMVGLSSLRLLPVSPAGTAVVIIPSRPVSQSDTAALRRYLEAGGLVALFDNFGFGNQLLGGLGLRVRFAEVPMLDPLFNRGAAWLPRILDVSLLPREAGLVSNYATALADASDMVVVARSSRYSFLDLRGSGRAESRDPRGPFAVAGWTHVGRGVVFVAADPNFLINAMLGLDDNRRFLKQVFLLAGDHPRVFLDEDHLPLESLGQVGSLDRAKLALRAFRAFAATPGVFLPAVLAAIVLPLMWGLRRGAATC